MNIILEIQITLHSGGLRYNRSKNISLWDFELVSIGDQWSSIILSVSFHVLKCLSNIFFNGCNRRSDNNVIFVLQGEPEYVDEGIDEVRHLGIILQLSPAPTPLVVGGSSSIQQLRGKMVPGNNLECTSWIGVWDSHFNSNYLKPTDSTGGEEVHSIFIERLKLAKAKKAIIICVEDIEPVVHWGVTCCINL